MTKDHLKGMILQWDQGAGHEFKTFSLASAVLSLEKASGKFSI
jgi:hypothetical protein